MTSPHICDVNVCGTGVYEDLYLICHICMKEVFIGCMRNRDKLTKDVLVKFGLATKNDQNQLELQYSNPDTMAYFQHTFNVDSPFAITCEACSIKFKNYCHEVVTDPITEDKLPATVEPTLRPPSPTPLKPPNADKNTLSSTQDEVKYEIYVSKFHPSTVCIDIANFITSKTSLENEKSFKVVKLIRRREYNKKRSFVSFKITTLSADDYDIILNSDIWKPEFSATPFIQKPKKQKTPDQKQEETKNNNVSKPANKPEPKNASKKPPQSNNKQQKPQQQKKVQVKQMQNHHPNLKGKARDASTYKTTHFNGNTHDRRHFNGNPNVNHQPFFQHPNFHMFPSNNHMPYHPIMHQNQYQSHYQYPHQYLNQFQYQQPMFPYQQFPIFQH